MGLVDKLKSLFKGSKENYTVELSETGADMIKVIKIVRDTTKLGLKEAKELTEAAPSIIKKDATREEAEKIKSELESVGAKVKIK